MNAEAAKRVYLQFEFDFTTFHKLNDVDLVNKDNILISEFELNQSSKKKFNQI